MRAAINVLAAAGIAAVPAAPALASVMNSNVAHLSSLKRTASAILTDIATNISTVASLDLKHTVQSLAYAVSQPTSSHADSEQNEIQINSAAVLEALGPLAGFAASE